MNYRDIVNRVRELRNPLERPPGLDPMDTRNKKLDSLRRLRKSQLEEIEEKELREDIKSYNKAKTTKMIFGDRPLDNISFRLRRRFRLRRPVKKGMFAGRSRNL